MTFKNARVVPMSDRQPGANALVVEGGLIRAVGEWTDVQAVARGPVFDLGGAAVLPGFIDTHMHPTFLGRALLGVDVSEAATVGKLVTAIKDRAEEGGDQGLILAGGLHPPALREGRNPTRAELDAATGRPVLVYNRGLHYCMANSAALAQAGIPPDVGGLLTDEQGLATGQLVGRALEFAHRALVEPWLAQIEPAELVGRVAHLAASRGVTTLHALDGRDPRGSGDDRPQRTVRALMEAGGPVDIVLYWETQDVDRVVGLGLPRIGGCILVDGGHEARTAAFLEPYADGPPNRGILYFEQRALDAFVWHAHSRGLQVAVHAIGDAAIEQALTAYERALQRLPRVDHRHRIEHFEFPTGDHVRRAARLGLALGIQPSFNHYWPHSHFLASLGAGRAAIADPIRSLAEAGILLGGGSDAPVTPLEPLLGIQAAVTHSRREERLSVEQALRLFTCDAARLAFEEPRKGSLEVGKQADLVVLSESPLEVPPEGLRAIQVLMTVHRGQVVYRRP
jgi:predicted amidohydrolase YtcJ